MGQPSVECYSSIQFLPHRIIRHYPILPHVWKRSSHKTQPTRIRKSKISWHRRQHDQHQTNVKIISAHNLNEARKAKDGNNKKKSTKNPDQPKIGDNVLVRDYTSKAFQPKYKDFCIIRLLRKNQVEIKDNHGHTTMVHCSSVKKIPMTEKICQLYKEEQIGKVRSRRKAIPDSNMPGLQWDTIEQLEVQESSQTDTSVSIFRETVRTIIILLVTFLINTRTCSQEISKEIAQVLTSTTRTISRNKYFKKACETYRKTVHVITDRTSTTLRNSRSQPHRIIHSHTQNKTSKQKPNDERDKSYTPYSTHSGNYKQ